MTNTATRTRAVAYRNSGPIDAPDALIDIEIDIPAPGPHDLLVEVRAVSVNPADAKVRAGVDPGGEPKILGFDAAGVVVGTGAAVTSFSVGDEVYYAGSIARPGSNAGLQLVDERITGHKPRILDFAEAAALPLTAITAWEALFDHLRLGPDSQGTLLVMAGAGGVGSMAVQLARKLTGVTVIGTASRPESKRWVQDMGAHHVVNHHHLREEIREVAPGGVDAILSPFSAGNVETYAEILRPRGAVVAIDEPEGLDTLPLKSKSQAWHWEFMFTRPLHEPESTYQRELLDTVARLVDDRVLRTTISERLGPLNAETLRAAHRRMEASGSIGKIVLTVG
ncbi:zinc-binding alcohol dehydrogenase family protein [Pseudonocardia xinjiangensis]|uniref:Zinc-type alcohol dehydrogenase-like protein n=1 Tax=Pseudonocardia xinjiangensis TaxID=75289 RepID=A0ABX1RMV0_9PSEU|nr:zinc-binding alcohol dehydrogenase family protein [Pseudonocardia xinjiangensis]NMH81141.1 zinc-binding alcohol dehydrogenase family protein [Pseudonocardia xinjiangensis]